MRIQDDNDEALLLPSDLTRCTGAVPGLGRAAICGKPNPHLAHDFSPSEQDDPDDRPYAPGVDQ